MTDFDPGYGEQPFRRLCEEVPGTSVYPRADFRIEWGPVFHRGRLDGSAKVLVIGQDPAQHETIIRRILVGEAGHRLQGFLAKLGIDRSYVLVNTFLFSVLGQGGGERHRDDAKIAAYRNKWLTALIVGKEVEAVVALGSLAESAWQTWKRTSDGKSVDVAFRRITHPTQPEAAGGGAAKHAAAIKRMLENWNEALQALHPLQDPDRNVPLRPYGTAFAAGEKVPIPEADVPPGTPDWMRIDDGWADRPGTGLKKRRTIAVTVPRDAL
jgi:Uracil DNA glycosylase superfamily